MNAHPFIEGFKLGIHPDFTPGQGNEPVPMLSTAELRKLAAYYQCSVKTLRRLLHRGVDISDASAVACHLANQKSISLEMAEAVLSHLETNTSDD